MRRLSHTHSTPGVDRTISVSMATTPHAFRMRAVPHESTANMSVLSTE